MSAATCPNCGAPEAEGTQPADASCSFFKCGSIVGTGIVTTSWPCREIAQLRSKLTPEGAETLKWEYDFPTRTHIAEGAGGRILGIVHRDGIDLWCGDEVVMENFIDIDTAKAHAEELHQAAWREHVKKWGRK